MKLNSIFALIAIGGIAIGVFIGRATVHTPEISDDSESASSFEGEALGFLAWYQLNGREAISHEVLTGQLWILESKAISSGVLLPRPGIKTNAERGGARQPATAVDSESEGSEETKPSPGGRSQ